MAVDGSSPLGMFYLELFLLFDVCFVQSLLCSWWLALRSATLVCCFRWMLTESQCHHWSTCDQFLSSHIYIYIHMDFVPMSFLNHDTVPLSKAIYSHRFFRQRYVKLFWKTWPMQRFPLCSARETWCLGKRWATRFSDWYVRRLFVRCLHSTCFGFGSVLSLLCMRLCTYNL